MKVTLDKTPPELAADIMEQGIVLAGGGALLNGLDARLEHETGMPIVIAPNPLVRRGDRLGPVARGVRGPQGRAVLVDDQLVPGTGGSGPQLPAQRALPLHAPAARPHLDHAAHARLPRLRPARLGPQRRPVGVRAGRRLAGAAVFGPIGDAWSSAFDHGDLQAENDRLREEIDQLQGQVTAGQVSQEQLQQLLENEGITFIGDLPRAHAQVVAGSVGNFDTTIDIDKGSSSGIAVGMAVVTGKGLVGKVVQVSEDRSTVELITSGNYKVGFNVVGTRAVGVAQGTGSPSVLAASTSTSRSARGRARAASWSPAASRRSFPPDLPIGTVATVETDDTAARETRGRHTPVRPNHRPDLRRRRALATRRHEPGPEDGGARTRC